MRLATQWRIRHVECIIADLAFVVHRIRACHHRVNDLIVASLDVKDFERGALLALRDLSIRNLLQDLRMQRAAQVVMLLTVQSRDVVEQLTAILG